MVVTADRLNVRTGPGTDFPVVRQMLRGTQVLTVGEPEAGGWAEVRFSDGKRGYVASPYLGTRSASVPDTTQTAGPKSAPVRTDF